ncbi:MAG: four helix bundle protein [Bacteroidota bacterium]|jgi:four helix bundle protein
MDSTTLKLRTKKFALDVIELIKSDSTHFVSAILYKQLVRSSTSIGANYRAACRAKSKNDFIYKIGIVEEEADESLYWLELITESNLLPISITEQLIKEANELTAIFTAIRKSSRTND